MKKNFLLIRKISLGLSISFLLILLLNSLALGAAVPQQQGVILVGKIGTQQYGLLKDGRNGQQEFDSNMGYSVSGEVLTRISETLDLGGGFEYQFLRDFKERVDNLRLGTTPIYALVRYNIPYADNMDLFVGGQVGYSFLRIDGQVKENYEALGGLYLGVSGGVVYEKMTLVELAFGYTNGKLREKVTKAELKQSYATVTLSLGMNCTF